jgi:uncharacterized membrane protein
MVISGAVLLYQIGIFTLIYASSSWSGTIRALTIIGVILWTLTHVYLLPLMIIQFFTIIIAVNVSKKRFRRNQQAQITNQV